MEVLFKLGETFSLKATLQAVQLTVQEQGVKMGLGTANIILHTLYTP